MGPGPHKPKVLVYADSAVFSGAESILCDLVEGWHQAGEFDIAVAVAEVNRELSKRLSRVAELENRFSVPAQKLPLAALDLYNRGRQKAVREVVRRSAPDLIVLNLPSAEYGATPLLVRPDPAIPVVGLMHISGTMAEMGFRLGSIRTVLARRAVSRLDHVLLPSETARRKYPARWKPVSTTTEVFLTPKPEVETVDQNAARDKLGLPQGATIIGTIGRITMKQKGQDTLVAAARKLVENHDDLVFAIIGDGQDRNSLHKLVLKAGLGEHFYLTGQVTDVGVAMSAIDLIAIPSRFEGLPLVALEALEAGVPGVASSVDGLCDVWPVDWRVAPDDPVALASSLGMLIEGTPAIREQLVETGRLMAEHWTAPNASDLVAEGLERVIASA